MTDRETELVNKTSAQIKCNISYFYHYWLFQLCCQPMGMTLSMGSLKILRKIRITEGFGVHSVYRWGVHIWALVYLRQASFNQKFWVNSPDNFVCTLTNNFKVCHYAVFIKGAVFPENDPKAKVSRDISHSRILQYFSSLLKVHLIFESCKFSIFNQAQLRESLRKP